MGFLIGGCREKKKYFSLMHKLATRCHTVQACNHVIISSNQIDAQKSERLEKLGGITLKSCSQPADGTVFQTKNSVIY